MRWTCPNCDREFGKRHQSHTCIPGNDLATTFARFPPGHREICEQVIATLRAMGPLHVDAVMVGVFLKSQRKFAELRPKQRWVSLELVLPDRVDDPRITRQSRLSEGRVIHVIRLHQSQDVDEQLRDWLALGYDAATD